VRHDEEPKHQVAAGNHSDAALKPSERWIPKRTGKLKDAPLESVLVGWLAFLLIFAGMGAAQYLLKSHSNWNPHYLWLRGGVWAAAVLPVLFMAFRDSSTTGWIALFFPPFLIYYGLERVHSFWVRGFFAGMLLNLGMEIYLLKDASLLALSQAKVTWLIDRGHALIEAAGNQPVF
jgi:hypothetical protein